MNSFTAPERRLPTISYRDQRPTGGSQFQVRSLNGKFHATKIRTFNKAKNQYYTTYNIQPTNARSKCVRDTVPISALRKCAIEMPLTQLQVCNYMLAWTEGDWSSVEIEGTCDIRAPRIAYSHKAGSY
ncbi:unnamed protein product [Toxocara canis]|uniref:Uncharacterized protein n=1 Tax=Toxocara canis TaxID=6265 RepID=A0A183UMK6_TOXCA|nr:unnamed protein product [Toxocara canis]